MVEYNWGKINYGSDKYHNKFINCTLCNRETRERDKICIICKIEQRVQTILDNDPLYQLYKDRT